jgi:hypothetical protein
VIAAVVLDPDFGPDDYLTAGRLGGWFLDYEARRMLAARGGGSGGWSGRGGRGSGRSGRVRIPAALRQSRRATDARVRQQQRAVEIARAQEQRAKRFYQQASAQRRDAVAKLRQTVRDLRESERARKAELKILAHFLTPAQQRSSYQRRVVSGVSRQLDRGEAPSIGRAIGRGAERRNVTEQFRNRLLKLWPAARNETDPFDLDFQSPNYIRQLNSLSDDDLQTLIRLNIVDFNEAIEAMLGDEPVELQSSHPLYYRRKRTIVGVAA